VRRKVVVLQKSMSQVFRKWLSPVKTGQRLLKKVVRSRVEQGDSQLSLIGLVTTLMSTQRLMELGTTAQW